MDFRVEITGPAIADLAEIVSYIAQDNPSSAKALGENLLDAALSLSKTPFKGSRYQMLADVRKLPLPPFKIFYRDKRRDESGSDPSFLAFSPSRSETWIGRLNLK